MASHTHQFQRRTLGKAKDYVVYACVHPKCNTYYPEDLIVGKESVCNRCKDTIIVVKRNSSGKIPHRPHCEECTYEPKNPALRKRKVVSVPKSNLIDLTKLLLED